MVELVENTAHFVPTYPSGARPHRLLTVASRPGGNQRQCLSEATDEPTRLSTNALTPKPTKGMSIFPDGGHSGLFPPRTEKSL
jgi:hypothetical protein